MPKVEDIFAQLNGVIPLDESLIPKTAFTSPFGKYEYIKGTLQTCTKTCMFPGTHDRCPKGLPFVTAYLDDIIIFCRMVEEHVDHTRKVFEKLPNAYLSMKLSKCNFFAKEIQYLGHILRTTGIRPLPSVILTIKNMYPPKTA